MLTYPGPARARDEPGPKSVCLLQTAAHQEDGGAELLHLERQEAMALPQKPDLEGKKNLSLLTARIKAGTGLGPRPLARPQCWARTTKAQAQFSIKPDPKAEQK